MSEYFRGPWNPDFSMYCPSVLRTTRGGVEGWPPPPPPNAHGITIIAAVIFDVKLENC
jgi:hypothetical protein